MTTYRIPSAAAAIVAVALLAGCAGKAPPQPDHDPWEGYNRKMFAVNDWLDRNALEPVARGWSRAVPEEVQSGLVNLFNNLRFPIIFTNDLLQGSPRDAGFALIRVITNLTWGVGGLFDVASAAGIPHREQDTGLTLGRWGIAPGPYLVLPILGPSSPRDTAGLAGDFALGVYTYFVPLPGVTAGAAVIDVINRRAQLLDTVTELKGASLDYYVAVRNAWVQRRYRLISSGVAPSDEEQEDLYNAEVFEDDLEGDDGSR